MFGNLCELVKRRHCAFLKTAILLKKKKKAILVQCSFLISELLLEALRGPQAQADVD